MGKPISGLLAGRHRSVEPGVQPSTSLPSLFAAILFIVLHPIAPLQAATLPITPGAVQSSSRQFIIHGPGPDPGTVSQDNRLTDDVMLKLDRDLAAIACERIKRAFLTELQIQDGWRGRITVRIDPKWSTDRQILLESGRFSDGWRYQMTMPPQVPARSLVRHVTELLLQEFANRNAGTRAAEIPFWLAEGMSRHLLAAYPAELVIRPNSRSTLSFAKTDPLELVRGHLSTNRPLSFNDLSLPGQAELTAAGGLTYSYCAQLLYHELTRYHNSRQPFVTYLSNSSRYLNWQSAFLETYRETFPRLLDVEKWWAITLVNITGRDPSRAWSFQQSMTRLEDLLKTPAHVSIRSRELPQRATVNLQQIVSTWDPVQQQAILRQKLTQLTVLRQNCSHELLPVVEEYRKTIDNYINRRIRAGFAPTSRTQPMPSVVLLVRETVQKLDDIDKQRQAVTPNPVSAKP